MAYPVYEDNGGIAAGQDYGVAIPYPSTVNANDILVILVLDADNDTFGVPIGTTTWYRIHSDSANSNCSYDLFWTRAAGTESGTIQVDSVLDAGQLVCGVMFRFSGCITSGTPFEDPTEIVVSQSTSPASALITTLGTERLAACFVAVEDNILITGFSNYTSRDQVVTTVGSDANLVLATQQKATAGDVTAEIFTLASTEYWGSITLAFIPGAGGTAHTYYPNDTMALSESLTRTTGFKPKLSDTLSLSDSFGKVSEFYRSLSDILTLADSISNKPGLNLSDNITFSDDLITVSEFFLAIDDTLSLSDDITTASGFFTALADTLALDEAFGKESEFFRSLSDVLSITDLYSDDWAAGTDHTYFPTDTLSLSDSISLAVKLYLSDTMVITDSFAKVSEFKRSLNDTLSFEDTLETATKFFADLADTLSLSDGISNKPGLNLSDTLAIVDKYEDAMSFYESLSDVLNISDGISSVSEFKKALADTLSLSDSYADDWVAAQIGNILNSLKSINILHAKIPGLDKATIFFQPVPGCGVVGTANENNYGVFKLYGIPFDDNNPVELCDVKLKDYAKTGFYASGSDYRKIAIPSGNSSGKITMVIGDLSEADKYELFYYTVSNQEYLIDFIDVQLIRDSFSTLKKGNTS